MGKTYKRWKQRQKKESVVSESELVVKKKAKEKRVIPKKTVKEKKPSIWSGTLGQ